MNQYVTLVGAEAVENAARSMAQSAETISHAANALVEALQHHERAMREIVEQEIAAFKTNPE